MKPDPAVLLWWEETLLLLTPDGRLLSSPVHAGTSPQTDIQRLLLQGCGREAALRVIYHPRNLEVHVVGCPDTSRAKLRAVFSHHYPALTLPDTIWSAEKIRRHGDTHESSTVLYIDRQSKLPSLLAALHESGIEVEGVWPLQSLIEATQPGTTPSAIHGFVSVIAIGRHSLVSCLRPDNGRFIRFQERDSPRLGPDLNAALAFFEGHPFPPGIIVVDESAPTDLFGKWVDDLSLQQMTPAELLGHARYLQPRGYSDFMPRPAFQPLRSAGPAIVAAAGITLIAASLLGIYQDRKQARAAHAAIRQIESEQTQLTTLIASRRLLRDEIEWLQADIVRLRSSSQPHHHFLSTLATALPKTMCLESVEFEGARFTLAGKVFDDGSGTSSPPLSLRRALLEAGGAWKLDELRPDDRAGTFTVSGTWTHAR